MEPEVNQFRLVTATHRFVIDAADFSEAAGRAAELEKDYGYSTLRIERVVKVFSLDHSN